MRSKSTKIKKGSTKENYVPNNNVLSGIFDLPGVGGFGGIGGGQPPPGFNGFGGAGGRIAPLSEPWELIYNNSYYLLSLLRVVLTYAYTIHGPLKKVVNAPVYDAFRGGITITTDEVSEEEKEDLHRKIKKIMLVNKAINALRWGRLYGGAGIIINTNQDYKQPFDVNSINESSLLDFIVADRWQLQWNGVPDSVNARFSYVPGGYSDNGEIFIGNIHPSRVSRILGEEAPAMIRQRLQGWGMSCLEALIRPMNLYFKEENAMFEYIDEFKVDVVKIEGFNAQTLNKFAHGIVSMRLQIAMWMKNFLNAIVMDSKDDFEQKQITFSGMDGVMEQIRINIACACDMPMSKLFGLSAEGFDSGESDMEIYNAIVENVREQAETLLRMPIEALMMQEWGIIPDDWGFEWEALRVLSAEQEQNVLNSKHLRNMDLYDRGLYTPQETMDAEKKDGVVNMETEVAKGAEPEPPISAMGLDEDPTVEDPKKNKAKKAPKAK